MAFCSALLLQLRFRDRQTVVDLPAGAADAIAWAHRIEESIALQAGAFLSMRVHVQCSSVLPVESP